MRSESPIADCLMTVAGVVVRARRISKMRSVMKWMLVVSLIWANGGAFAREEAYNLDSVAGDTSCKAPFLCIPGVRPNLKAPLTNGMLGRERGSQRRYRSFLLFDDLFDALFDDLDGTPGSGEYKKGLGSSNEPGFECGEVVSGYT